MAAKFGLLFHKLGHICLEWFLLPPATRVIELKDIRYAREMENNFSNNAFCKNPKANGNADES